MPPSIPRRRPKISVLSVPRRGRHHQSPQLFSAAASLQAAALGGSLVSQGATPPERGAVGSGRCWNPVATPRERQKPQGIERIAERSFHWRVDCGLPLPPSHHLRPGSWRPADRKPEPGAALSRSPVGCRAPPRALPSCSSPNSRSQRWGARRTRRPGHLGLPHQVVRSHGCRPSSRETAPLPRQAPRGLLAALQPLLGPAPRVVPTVALGPSRLPGKS
mmetsp:Transcript_15946/g.37682  ORF Transcript_15946/g.37682 Transcript_15946/m.37682 type:complete len:219 (+) Transcript_15946:946-1602(+)